MTTFDYFLTVFKPLGVGKLRKTTLAKPYKKVIGFPFRIPVSACFLLSCAPKYPMRAMKVPALCKMYRASSFFHGARTNFHPTSSI